MFDITLWVKIFREFGHTTPNQLKIFKQCIQTYEQVEFQIFELKIKLTNEKISSEFDIDVYLMCLNSLALLLIQNWQQIVVSSLCAIRVELENCLSQKMQPFSKVKRSIAYCQKIEIENISKNYLKRKYISPNIEDTLGKIETLKEFILKKYCGKILDPNFNLMYE